MTCSVISVKSWIDKQCSISLDLDKQIHLKQVDFAVTCSNNKNWAKTYMRVGLRTYTMILSHKNKLKSRKANLRLNMNHVMIVEQKETSIKI